jgi:hypothetical protein
LRRDEKKLLAGEMSPQEFQARQNARGVGAAAAATAVLTAIYGPGIAEAIVLWVARNPDKVQQVANVAQEAGGGPPAALGGVTASVEGAATKLEGIVVNKAVNSELGHAAGRAFERGFFSSVKDASNALRALSKEITANGLPAGTIRDSAHADRVLVPLKDGAYAVYQIAKNGTPKLKTVLIARE